MLELDLLFRPFVESCFTQLSREMQIALDELLQRDDFELLELIQQPDQIPTYSTLIRAVLQFRTSGTIADTDLMQTSVKKHQAGPLMDE